MGKSEVPEVRPREIGRSVLRREDPAVLSGRARYTADLNLPEMLRIAILRSPLAHARILSVDIGAACALPGVLKVWTGADMLTRCPGLMSNMDLPGFVATAQPILADDVVRFVGEAVAVVVATDQAIAEDALELIDVDYEELPVVADIAGALDADAIANENVPKNCVYTGHRRQDDVAELFADAHCVVSGSFENNRVSAAPMEPRGCIASFDWTSEQLTVWAATQMPSFLKTMLSIHLAFSEDRIEVITPQVGGGFGQKAHVHPEEVLVCALALELGRPIRWIEDRRDNLLAATHAKHQINKMEIALDERGRILAMRNNSFTDGGAYNCLPWTQLVESHVGASTLTGPYRVGALFDESHSLVTNKCPIGAYRGVGWSAGHIARETLIDRAARKLEISPFEIRRRNLVEQADYPYTTPAGLVIREGTFLETLDQLERMVDYPAFRQRQKEALRGGKLLGLGLCVFNEVSGVGTRALSFLHIPVTTHDTASVRVEPTGKITVTTPLVAAGQGHLTTFAQIAADAFGVPLEDVTVWAGSTRNTYGFGTVASRGAVFGAGTIGRAAEAVRVKIRRLAGHLLQTDAQNISISDGRVHVLGDPERGMPLSELAGAAYFADATHPSDFDPALEATAAFDPADIVLANGGHAAIVEIDLQTCIPKVTEMFAVEDCGKMINPMIVEGQIRGGIAQAIGMTLLEELVHDSDGQLTTTTLMDYLMPTSADVPDIQISHLETPSDLVPGGIKGMGESGMISAPAAIVGAVNDALAQLGASLEAFPASPQRIYDALQVARTASAPFDGPAEEIELDDL
ncbi:MAG: xanthine dehydrogenase [Altererythrobacter sp. XM-24bin4]|uniref:xanthine dehydrogenase family protein molybdopterin-binding subunit n=1 Tax=uncultured Altererythrobacter sp. TaxID=500840 RepID=UPI000D7A0044|nr:xanthine dehydrogenase family protein molybdopterin-binding subunit [uncultured Altererythrobacter sp.]PWL25494.1 MAG: xanthine dehydrogenase [Altererythrobacter sp. XM-24bin4]